MSVSVIKPIEVTEVVYSASGIAEPDFSRGEVEWLPESQKEVITQLSGSGEYIEGNGILTTVHGEIFVISMDSSKKCYAKKFNSSLNEVGTISFFSDSGEPDADMRVCGTGVIDNDLLVYWQIQNPSNPNYPKIYGQFIEGAASKWTSPPSISPIVASLESVPSDISQSTELVMCRSGAFEYAGYRKTTGILKRPYIAKLNNDGSLALEVEFADQTEVSGLNSNGDDGVVASFYSVSSTDTTKVSNLTESLTEIKSSLINKGDDTAIGQSRYCAMYAGAYYVGVMLNSSGVNAVNLGVYDSDFLNSGSYKKDDEVITSSNHRKYRCLVEATFSDPRETATGDATAEWIDIGPTNKWAMFDDSISTKSVASSQFSFDLSVGTKFDAIAFFGCEGIQYITVIIKNIGGTFIEAKTVDMIDSDAALEWGLDDNSPAFIGDALINDLTYGDGYYATVTITPYAGFDAKVQLVSFGLERFLGKVISESTRQNYQDLSEYKFDEFGESVIVKRPVIKMDTYSILTEGARIGVVDRFIKSIAGQFNTWYASIGNDQYMLTYGSYERSPTNVTANNHRNYVVTVRSAV